MKNGATARRGRLINPSSLSNKLPIIVAGPTGVGKTAFAVELSIRLGGEIVGADAFQVYAGLEILTSQPDAALRARVPHHLVAFLSPSESFDAARFVVLARHKIDEIQARGRVPILVGGSGLYLKALTHGLTELPAPDPDLRAELNALPPEESRRRLEEADPTASQYIDMKNPRRVLRALEISLLTGRSAAELRHAWKDKAAPGFAGLLLVRGRPELDARIAENVDAMFAQGVVEEVRQLGEVGPTAQAAIGLREIQSLLRGELTLPACRESIVLATRRYAKRQLTWFRNQFTFPSIDLTGLRHPQMSLSVALQTLGYPV